MKKGRKSKHILTVTLAALIVLSTAVASVMSGCGESAESTGETVVVSETQIVTSIVEETYATDENGETIVSDQNSNSSDSDSNSSENSESGNNSSSNTSKTSSGNSSQSSNSSNNSDSSKTSSNSSSNKTQASNASSDKSNSNGSNNSDDTDSNNSSSSNSSSDNKTVSSSKALTIDGKKVSKGSTVTCVYKLKSPEALENYQASIKYDSKYLKVTSAKLSEEARGGGILNFKLDGEIKFNGSNISSGYDYENGGEFLTVTYEALATGSTTTTFEWEVATGMSGKSYVTDNKPASGLKISKTYS